MEDSIRKRPPCDVLCNCLCVSRAYQFIPKPVFQTWLRSKLEALLGGGGLRRAEDAFEGERRGFLEVKMTCLDSQETEGEGTEVRERLATLDPEAPVSPLAERGATK